LTQAQLEQVLGSYGDSDEYTHVRDWAMLVLYAASGLRFVEVLYLELDQVHRYGQRIRTIGKSNRERVVRVGDRALKAVRAYRRVLRAQDGVAAPFTTDAGGKLTYPDGQSIFLRLKKASGLPWMHPHRFHHTWAQTALRKGAERSIVQDTMGWPSDCMVRRLRRLGAARDGCGGDAWLCANLMPGKKVDAHPFRRFELWQRSSLRRTTTFRGRNLM
jgi:site-specific recombinase XerD